MIVSPRLGAALSTDFATDTSDPSSPPRPPPPSVKMFEKVQMISSPTAAVNSMPRVRDVPMLSPPSVHATLLNVQSTAASSRTVEVPAVSLISLEEPPPPDVVTLAVLGVPAEMSKLNVAFPPVVFLTIVKVGVKSSQSGSARSTSPSLSLSMPSQHCGNEELSSSASGSYEEGLLGSPSV